MADHQHPESRLRRLMRSRERRPFRLWRLTGHGRRRLAMPAPPPAPPDGPAHLVFAISDTGGGHRSAAVAIDAAVHALAPRSVTTIMDVLARTEFPVVSRAPELYNHLSSTRWLPVYDRIWKLTDSRWQVNMLARLVYSGSHRKLLRALMESQPHVVVSVHPMLNHLLSRLRRAYRLPVRVVTVVTDLVTLHTAWVYPGVDLVIVPTREAYDYALRRGVPPKRLILTGFPVHPKFTNCTLTKTEARALLGLTPDAFTVLVTGGGVGAGNLHRIVLDLRRACPGDQVLVVTGKNQALKQQLERARLGPLTRIYGFVNNMEQLMAASDVVVTKAGPGMLMETLVMRRPALVTEAVGHQEQGNIDFILNYELGFFCPTTERIVAAMQELRDPGIYQASQLRLANAIPRDGSTQIARLLIEQAMLAPSTSSVRRGGIHLPARQP